MRKHPRERHAKIRSDQGFVDQDAAMTEAPRERKRTRLKGLQSLTCGAVGLLVAFDVINMRVPLYCLGLASDGVGDVFHAVTRLVRHGLPDVLDQFERNAITVSDAQYLALTAVLIGAGFVFLRNTLAICLGSLASSSARFGSPQRAHMKTATPSGRRCRQSMKTRRR
jgi:hypothetical protein